MLSSCHRQHIKGSCYIDLITYMNEALAWISSISLNRKREFSDYNSKWIAHKERSHSGSKCTKV